MLPVFETYDPIRRYRLHIFFDFFNALSAVGADYLPTPVPLLYKLLEGPCVGVIEH